MPSKKPVSRVRASTSTHPRPSQAAALPPAGDTLSSVEVQVEPLRGVFWDWVARTVTIEMAAFAALGLIALGLRFAQLDFRPLSSTEAAQALEAYRFNQTANAQFVASPFLFTANAMLFFLFGASDYTARATTALFGVLLCLLPWLARRELGRGGALLAGLFFAFSPSLNFLSRSVEGNTVAVTAAFAAVLLLWGNGGHPTRLAWYGAGVAAAIALTAGPAAYTVLLAAASWWAVHQARRVVPTSAAEQKTRRVALYIFGGAFLLLSTSLLTNRGGLGGALNLFGDWIGGLAPFGSLGTPLSLLFVYEPLALVFGLGGLVLFLFNQRVSGGLAQENQAEAPVPGSLIGLAAWWAILALILYSAAADKSPASLPAVLVPLFLLAAWFQSLLLSRAAQTIVEGGGWPSVARQELPVAALALALVTYVYFQAAHWVNLGQLGTGALPPALAELPYRDALLLGAVTLVSLAIVALLGYGLMGAARAANLGAVLLFALLFLGTVRAIWLATYSDEPVGRELLTASQTSFQARDLANDLGEISRWRANDAYTLKIEVAEGLGPLVDWYLRQFPVQQIARPTARSGAQAILTDSATRLGAADWIFQDYALEMRWTPSSVQGLDLWRWLIFRSAGQTTWSTVRLWIPRPY